MSGICAVWRQGNPEQIKESLADILGGLATHSAEQTEYACDGEAAIGVSARFPMQRMYSDASILLACDADLSNEDELWETVQAAKPAEKTGNVAALIAILFERFGYDCVEKLRGSFAIVLWDKRNRKLAAAVDGCGSQRLAYYQDAKVLLVASRVDALARAEDIAPKINPRAIADILNFSSTLAPQTIFENVHRLTPGTILIASGGQARTHQYWDMQYKAELDSDEKSLSRTLELLVERSVVNHCNNVPFAAMGAFLSGGTDSSTVAGMMNRAGRGQVRTFSIGFQEQAFNELGYAEIAARSYKTDHHTYLVGPQDCFDALPHIIRGFDEPFGNSSAVPTYFCARLAAQNGVQVLLAGDGGDELFGGNERYLTDKVFEVYQQAPEMLRKHLIEPVLGIFPFANGLVGKARRYIQRSNVPPLQRYFSYNFLCAHQSEDIFTSDFRNALAGYSVLDIPSHHYHRPTACSHLERLLYVDLKVTLADNDLAKVTCMSDLAGVRARFPLLDRTLIEFSGRIPPGLKIKGFDKRYLFKQAFRELLPPEVIKKKKHGFGIPVSMWLKSYARFRELSRDTLLSRRAIERGYFKRAFIEDLFCKHEADESTYYGDTLWTFLALELWHRQVVDQPIRATA